ncbi:O-fucosyltransferase 2 [Carabus blaptoides fortunei]
MPVSNYDLYKYAVILLLIFMLNIRYTLEESNFCGIHEEDKCSNKINNPANRYILYDINPPEGFNLRRDVYMRLAVLGNLLKKSKNNKLKNFKIVLPPWSELYHWRSQTYNMHIPWSHFFDLGSLQKFAPVIEMYQFFNEVGSNYEQLIIDEVFILQNFEDMFETGNFEDKMAVEECTENETVNFYKYDNLTSNNIRCLSFHGHASQLISLLEKSTSNSILFDHAEIVLHDRFGDRTFWEARRSMRFSKKLRFIANEFREKYLNSTDELDNTFIPEDWTTETPHRNAKGGPYICVHLRRRDFVWGRPSEVPDIEHAARQIKHLLQKYNLNTVFVATDAPLKEYNNLKGELSKYKVHKYSPSGEIMEKHKDGGVAIIEQIICSHAFYFIGTHESTFSFRIQEEREILGFPIDRTFNRLCGTNKKCEKPSLWKIVF